MTGGIDIMTDGGDGEPAGGEPDREPDPSDSLRTWGAVQQALREHAGYSRAEFADLVRFSKHTVESVELGRRMPDESYVVRSEELLGNTGALRKSSKYVTRGRGDVGLAAWFRQWARLERVAVSLCTYECRLVPGLLQSEGYARALFENRLPLLTEEQTGAAADAARAADGAVSLHRGGVRLPAQAGRCRGAARPAGPRTGAPRAS